MTCPGTVGRAGNETVPTESLTFLMFSTTPTCPNLILHPLSTLVQPLVETLMGNKWTCHEHRQDMERTDWRLNNQVCTVQHISPTPQVGSLIKMKSYEKFSSSAALATFQVLNSHRWLVVTIVGNPWSVSLITEASIGCSARPLAIRDHG